MGCLLLIAALAAGSAAASPAAEAPLGVHWYGWQTLIADAAVFGTFALAVRSGSSSNGARAVGAVAELAYVFGGPIVHKAHGREWTGAADLGLRVALPLVLAFASQSSPTPYCGSGCGAAFGLLLGAGLASALDAAALAWEPAPSPNVARPLLIPVVQWAKGRDGVAHLALGLLAAF